MSEFSGKTLMITGGTGSFGNTGKRQQRLLGAQGGKIRRKKGLTI